VCSLDYEEQVLVDGTQGRTTVHPAQCIESLTLFCSLTDGVCVLLFGLPGTRIVRSASCFVHKRGF
jgi:hypothetical protein